MINIFIKNYIKKQAKLLNIAIPSNYAETLEEMKKLSDGKTKIIYSRYLYKPQTHIAASLSLCKNYISINALWAARLVLDSNEETINAFRITVGHELTHKTDKDYYKLIFVKNKLVSWVNEVHADFGGCQKMADCNRQKLINSIEYKINLYDNNYENSDTHPSWQRRKYYAKNFDFNRELIEQIAEDAGCKDERLIQKVCNYYDDIILI